MTLLDARARALGALRLSVTDRCNLRCRYCMPSGPATWLPRSEILSFDEIATLAEVLVGLGAGRVRLTGGEPLVRRDLPELVKLLVVIPGLDDLALTTNGVGLERAARPLREAGLRRITVSIDTLDRERFASITGTDALPFVLAGIEAALDAGLRPLKTDTVVLRGTNDHEIAALLDYAWTRGIEPRLIEYMPVGSETPWRPDQAMTAEEIVEAVRSHYGPATALPHPGSAPARLYEVRGGQRFGIVAANSAPFCSRCDRARLTANGMLLRCLHSRRGLDLKKALRDGADRATLTELVRAWWSRRDSRGAELRATHGRLRAEDPRAAVPPAPAREVPSAAPSEAGAVGGNMHVRGG